MSITTTTMNKARGLLVDFEILKMVDISGGEELGLCLEDGHKVKMKFHSIPDVIFDLCIAESESRTKLTNLRLLASRYRLKCNENH